MDQFSSQVIKSVSRVSGLVEDQIQTLLETPPKRELGDLAMPCFVLAKQMRKAPPIIAQELAADIASQPFESLLKVEAVGGYLNFFVKPQAFAQEVLSKIALQGRQYGSNISGQGKTVCIDYSSINIAKRFHIGHLSTTMIGHALRNLYAFCGWKVIGINHLGDWGTQFGKMIAAWQRWGSEEMLEDMGVDALVSLYVRFDQESADDETLAEEGRNWFLRMENGDAEALAIFERFKEITLKDASRVYDLLGVSFDSYHGEAFFSDKTQGVVNLLNEKGLLVESQGAQVVDLSTDNMPPCIVLKQDGATVYATRDLAAALYRQNTYHFDRCLYVVAYQQSLHFQQVFRVLELMGYDWAKNLHHVAFGMVSYEGQTLSTRKGHVVYLEELLTRSIEKARDIIEEKSPQLENKDEVAKQIGIGAIVFFDLYNNRIKDIDFWWDRALSFEGETGPYVQYTHARCCSVLRKAGVGYGEALKMPVTGDYLDDAHAQAVLSRLAMMPSVIADALERNEPSLVTRYVVDLAQDFNSYYYEERILDDENKALQLSRLQLTDAVLNIISTCLQLLGISAPDRM